MRSTLFTLTLLALSMVWWPTPAIAQDAKVARGTITAIGGRSVTVRVGDENMVFGVDSKTVVQSRGAASASLRAAAADKPGPRLDELLQTGQTVAVTYNDLAGNLQATEIKSVPRAGASNASPAAMISAGVVTAIGPGSVTIRGAGGSGSSFEQSFTIDGSTLVFAKGASTAAAAKGGKVPFADLVSTGDHVTVSYLKAGAALHASEVRVTMKVTH